MADNAPIDFGELIKNANSTRIIKLEFFDNIASFWEGGVQIALNTFVRPLRSTGFSYEATVAGQTKLKEPRWPTTLNATVTDGEITWTARAAGANAVNVLSAPSALSVSPSGQLTATAVSVVDGKATNSRIQLTLGAGRAGSTYKVSGTVSSGGQTLAFEFTVHVK